MKEYGYDLGTYSRPATTGSPEAQRWFDRGLAWTYGYNHEEAHAGRRDNRPLRTGAAGLLSRIAEVAPRGAILPSVAKATYAQVSARSGCPGPGNGSEYAARYRLLSMKAESWVFDTAPTLVASTLPPLNSIRVGIPRMP